MLTNSQDILDLLPDRFEQFMGLRDQMQHEHRHPLTVNPNYDGKKHFAELVFYGSLGLDQSEQFHDIVFDEIKSFTKINKYQITNLHINLLNINHTGSTCKLIRILNTLFALYNKKLLKTTTNIVVELTYEYYTCQESFLKDEGFFPLKDNDKYPITFRKKSLSDALLIHHCQSVISSLATMENRKFEFGGIIYNLRRVPTVQQLVELLHYLDSHLSKYTSYQSDYFESTLHTSFQTLWYSNPLELSRKQKVIWQRLCQYVDINEYRLDNPVIDHRVGTMLKISKTEVKIRWNDGNVEYFSLSDVHPKLFAIKKNESFQAALKCHRNGIIDWIDLSSLGKAVKIDLQNITTDSSISYIDNLPEGTWEKREPR